MPSGVANGFERTFPVPKSASAKVIDDCTTHHWVIGAPSGAVSMGVCKLCGAEREFSAVPERGWVSRAGGRKATA